MLFLRAETIACDGYVALKGEAKAREAGKDVIKDGEIRRGEDM